MRPIAIALLLLSGAPALAADEDAAMGKRVQDLLHAHQADVFGCVAAANGNVKGEMLVRVMVGEDHRPVKADVLKDQTGLPALGPCLQAKMQKWDLASLKAAAGDQVVFPLVFKPEPLAKGQKRMLVPMAAQESQGPQRFLIDDESVGEAPLASVAMLSLPANAVSPAKTRKDDEEEMVLYVLDGGFKVGPDALKSGDVLWLGAHTDRPAITPADKKPLKLLEIRAHGEGTGQKVIHGADVKSYKIAGGKVTARLLLDGTGAKLAVDELDADAGAAIAAHKHQAQDEEIYFLSGRSTTTVGKQAFETAPGDALRIPSNTTHTMKVTEPLKAIQIYAPGGPEQRFKKEKVMALDFEETESEKILRATVREFARKEIAPHARKWDEEESFPAALVPKLAELGLMGMKAPEALGGAAMSTQDVAIVIEELARVDGSVALTVASHNGLASGHILLAGNDSQKKKYIPNLATGKWLGAWGLTEPSSGSDAAGAKTRAIKKGDNWILNGSKTFITQGSVGHVYVIIASTSPEKKQHGLTAFIVERGAAGFSVGKHIEKMGCHASDTAELNFADVEVPVANQLGEVDHGFIDTLQILDKGRIAIASMALGLGKGALEAARGYAKERKQFGRAIADNQAIQFMLADSAMELEAGRLLIKRAAWLADAGRRHTYESSTAKLWAAQAAMRACDRAIQIHGGYGYTREFPVERALRDCKLCEIGEGTNEVQRMVIARHLIANG